MSTSKVMFDPEVPTTRDASVPGEGASRPFLLQTGIGMKRFINDQVSFDLTDRLPLA